MARSPILSLFEMQSVDCLSISPDVHLSVACILRRFFWCSREEWPLFSFKRVLLLFRMAKIESEKG